MLLGDPYHWGGVGTRNTRPYIYILYINVNHFSIVPIPIEAALIDEFDISMLKDWLYDWMIVQSTRIFDLSLRAGSELTVLLVHYQLLL